MVGVIIYLDGRPFIIMKKSEVSVNNFITTVEFINTFGRSSKNFITVFISNL